MELMIRLNKTEAEYVKWPTAERARMIAALKVPEMLKVLGELAAVERARIAAKTKAKKKPGT